MRDKNSFILFITFIARALKVKYFTSKCRQVLTLKLLTTTSGYIKQNFGYSHL